MQPIVQFDKQNSTLLESKVYELVGDDRNEVLQQISRHLRQPSLLTNGPYPGPLPVTLLRSHLKDTIIQNEYMIAEKNDGQRMMLYFTRLKGVKINLLLSRNYKCYILNIHFSFPRDIYLGTLFDGEIVKDDDNHLTLHIFDTFFSYGLDDRSMTFSERLNQAKKVLYEYKYVTISDTCRLCVKQFFPISSFTTFLTYYCDIMDKSDGIVFIPNKDPLKQGRMNTLLKWKDCKNQTVDFVVDKNGNLLVQDRSRRVAVGILHDFLRLKDVIKTGDIIECNHLFDTTWKYIKTRTDKLLPNSIITFQGTIKTIYENIKLKDIVSSLGNKSFAA